MALMVTTLTNFSERIIFEKPVMQIAGFFCAKNKLPQGSNSWPIWFQLLAELSQRLKPWLPRITLANLAGDEKLTPFI
jgi:hypothetical protein